MTKTEFPLLADEQKGNYEGSATTATPRARTSNHSIQHLASLNDHHDHNNVIIYSDAELLSLIAVNKSYLERITAAPSRLLSVSLKEFVGAEIDAGSIIYFEPYEEIHMRNFGLLQT